MKTKILLLVTLFITSFSQAQKEADHSLTLDSKISDLYLHNTTGIPVVTTGGGVYGINGKTGEKIWDFKESGFISTLNALGQDGGSSFEEIPFSSFGKFGQTVFNIKTGEKIIDAKTNGFKRLVDSRLIPSKKAMLFVTKKEAKNEAKLFLVNLDNNTIIWDKELKVNKKVSSSGISNLRQNEKNITFTLGKNIVLLNKNDGHIVLNKKYDAGELFFTEDGKSLIAVENKSSSLIGGALKAGFTMGLSLLGKKAIGKELFAFDTSSGEEVWKKEIKLDEGYIDYQFVDGKLFLIHKDGGILYDYNTGKKVWKKNFKKNKVKGIEKAPEGYLVFYKNKKHLVDENGKKIWKKPERIIKNTDFDLEDDEDYTNFDYENGTIFVTPYRIEYFKKGKEKRVYKIGLNKESDKLNFDKKNKNLILLSGKKLYILNPDRNLGKDEVKKIDFDETKNINNVEVRETGYFIYGNWEYVITDFKGNVIKKAHFKQPGEGLRHLKNVGAFALGAAGAASQVSGMANMAEGSALFGAGAFVGQQNIINQGKSGIIKGSKQYIAGGYASEMSANLWDGDRYNAFKATKNNAFFYTRKDKKKVLLQINKDSGEIVESYEFSVNNPKYIIDKIEKRIYFRKGKDLKIFSYQ